jgi:23S rRNA (cytosine1962-C5)-methyltransferase
MSLLDLVDGALAARAPLFDDAHETAFRLFNGFVEGYPPLAVDLYARTLVIHDHAPSPEGDRATALAVVTHLCARLPWLNAALWKVRRARDPEARNGAVVFGTPAALDTSVRENGVWYALDLTLQRDASLYLDTRCLRAWATGNLAGQRVLNTFAYTGSLGVAARAAPAREVTHTDRSRAFLDLARRSYALNGFAVRAMDFLVGDFFDVSARLRREGALYDCVFLDPPFFSETTGGKVDLARDARRVIDKVRPLVGDQGRLVVVNNALFLAGRDWMNALDALCADGYLTIEAHLPVGEDFTGPPATQRSKPPFDPAPFAHTTRITVLRARRKDGRRA